MHVRRAHKDLSRIAAAAFFHDRQKIETTQGFINRRLDKEIVVYSYAEILFTMNKLLIYATWVNSMLS